MQSKSTNIVKHNECSVLHSFSPEASSSANVTVSDVALSVLEHACTDIGKVCRLQVHVTPKKHILHLCRKRNIDQQNRSSISAKSGQENTVQLIGQGGNTCTYTYSR